MMRPGALIIFEKARIHAMAAFRSILVVDDEASIRHVLSLVLKDKGYEVRAVENGEEALKELSARPYDVVISDVRMPKVDGMALLKQALTQNPDLTFLVMSAYGSKDQALEAVAAGAFDFIQKPFKPEEVVFWCCARPKSGCGCCERTGGCAAKPPGSEPLRAAARARARPMKALKKQMQRVAPVETTVLITGESGTGKELVARALHDNSPRRAGRFVAVNCGASPSELLESELFGHARGAFTDARTAKRGLLADADGGHHSSSTKSASCRMPAQVKLLRVLQEGEVRPVGENRVEKVDVRVMAATLARLVEARRARRVSRRPLFPPERGQLRVPPLRERKDDIPLLAMNVHSARFNRTSTASSPVTSIARGARRC